MYSYNIKMGGILQKVPNQVLFAGYWEHSIFRNKCTGVPLSFMGPMHGPTVPVG